MDNIRTAPLVVGDPAPWFRAAAIGGSPDYVFDTAAGRPILMLLFGSASNAECASALKKVRARRTLFDDERASFFGVTVDPADAAKGRVAQELPGLRFFLDEDRNISRSFGALVGHAGGYRPHWLLLDRAMRVVGRFSLRDGDAALDACAAFSDAPAQPDWAPVLMVPDVIEPPLCRQLIALYEEDGGEDSGFMRDVDGKTRLLLDPSHKVRRDFVIEDIELMKELRSRLQQRLDPMIRRAFQFAATRLERMIVSCYDAESGGHFRAHRDNTTIGTAHRQFAITINLNPQEYEGGDLVFPEYGSRRYRAPLGGAIVFSCSLLHRAMPVTKGRRFALLPFLYDEEGARLREQNAASLEGELAHYKAGPQPDADPSP